MTTENQETTEQRGDSSVESTALLDVIRDLHETWKRETNANRNIEWWDEDEEWKRVEEAYQRAIFLASNAEVSHGDSRCDH